ncbi:MAG: hypothetical protein NWE89_14430 [Candidatus Bathyarchaeota archaeon]|nr:hypothetical protein [Candidatus Bathyarchaeota archaeon]
MSTYEIGAFEALEWAWKLLRTQNQDVNIDEAQSRIQEMLYTLGSGTQVNFQQQISELQALS